MPVTRIDHLNETKSKVTFDRPWETQGHSNNSRFKEFLDVEEQEKN